MSEYKPKTFQLNIIFNVNLNNSYTGAYCQKLFFSKLSPVQNWYCRKFIIYRKLEKNEELEPWDNADQSFETSAEF